MMEPFDLVAFEVENRNGVFNGLFCGSALYGLDDDLACFFIGLEFGFLDDLPVAGLPPWSGPPV